MISTIQQSFLRSVQPREFWLLFAGCITLWTIILTLLFAPTTHAVDTVPLKMNFQGRLTNSSGSILPDGTYNMRFRLYNAATGGSLVWNESRLITTSNAVTLSNGLFSIRLGDSTALPANLFNSQTYSSLYLEVELPTPATATTASPIWTEGSMTPRNQLASSAYAFNSDTLDGLDSTNFAQVGGSNTFTGTNTFRKTSNSTNSFAIQDSSGTNLLIADTTNDRIYIGEPAADSNVTFLAVDNYNGSGNPAGGFPGAIYYNTQAQKFRCYESTYWLDCIPQVQVTGSATTVPGNWAATLAKTATTSILVTPIYLPAQITVNQIRLRVTTALGATGDVGLYDATSGTLLLNGGSGSLTVAAGLKTITPVQTGSSRLIFPGMYLLAVTWNSTTGVIGGGTLGVAGLKYNGALASGGGTVLPASISVGSIVDGNYMYGFGIND